MAELQSTTLTLGASGAAGVLLAPGEDVQFLRLPRSRALPYSQLLEELRIADAGDPQPARVGGLRDV